VNGKYLFFGGVSFVAFLLLVCLCCVVCCCCVRSSKKKKRKNLVEAQPSSVVTEEKTPLVSKTPKTDAKRLELSKKYSGIQAPVSLTVDNQ